MRYLLSILASLVLGGIWWGIGVRMLNLGVYATMFSGIAALALAFLLMGFLWLSIDLSRPVPEGVDEAARNYQLFILWIGIPAMVVALIGVVALLALVFGGSVFPRGVPGGR